MTRLFACTCNQPERISEALEPARASLIAKAPIARWGLGYIEGGEVLLRRKPKTSEADVDFFDAMEGIQSDYIIGHASLADGLRGNQNTQPFRFRRWMFAQEGSIDGFEAVQPGLLEHIPGFMQRNIKGKTPAEHVFHVFLSLLHDAGNLDDPKLPPTSSHRALRAALALVLGQMTKVGAQRSDRGAHMGNLVVSNGRSLVAVRLDGPLFMRRLTVPSLHTPDTRDDSFRGVMAVSANEEPGEGFEAIPPRSVLLVSRDLRTDIVHLDS
jgi:glutamine amidotransferase